MRTRFWKCRHHTTSKWYKLLFCFAGLHLVTLGLVLPYTCSEWAHSLYFQKPNNMSNFIRRVTALNNVAKNESEKYFQALDSKLVKGFYEERMKNPLNLTIAVITIERAVSHNPGYLTQTLAKLDKIIRSENTISHFSTSLFICDVNSDKKVHKEAEIMEKYFISQHVPKLKKKHSGFEKEKQDYVYCINQALRTGAKYLLMLEDDALPRDDLMDVLHFLLTNHNKLGQGHIGHKELGHQNEVTNDKWAFLKLYYPARWRGFGWELRHLADLIGITAIGGMVFLLISKMYFTRKLRLVFSKLDELLIFLIGCSYMAILAFAIGKPYLIDFLAVNKHLYRVSHAPDCCTPAVVFTKEKAQEIVDFLKTQTCDAKYGVDIAMDTFASSRHYAKLLVEPNLVTHIGMVSSLKAGPRFPEEFILR